MSCGDGSCGCCPKCGCRATCTCNRSMRCDEATGDFRFIASVVAATETKCGFAYGACDTEGYSTAFSSEAGRLNA